jgi:hypothetical protein
MTVSLQKLLRLAHRLCQWETCCKLEIQSAHGNLKHLKVSPWRCRKSLDLPVLDSFFTLAAILNIYSSPAAVILDIEEYRDLLKRLEDAEDLKMLNAMRGKPLRFRKFDDFLKETAGV